jgi:CRISPR-associated protein Cmr1
MRVYAVTEPVPPVASSPQAPALVSREFDLRAVTPIYKGAAQPDGVDERFPFRGPSLRGQLRAWWRAVHPYTDIERLRALEYRLFGGVHGENPRASRVALGLSDMSSTTGKKSDLPRTASVGTDFPYALWVDREGDKVLYHLDAMARLRVSFRLLPGDEALLGRESEHIERALRALILLGGSGSRSRRGLGRLWSDELFGATLDKPERLDSLLQELAPPAGTRPWPSLAGVRVAWKRGATLPTASKAANEALTDFRELRGMRSLGGKNFDGSRRLREAQEDWLRVRDHRPHPNAFTAALGMPLIYRSSNGHLDGVTTLGPGRGDRLPSPLHIRPVPTPSGWAPVIVALQPWFRGEIRARNRKQHDQGGRLNPDAVNILLDGLAARGWDVSPAGGAR